MPGGRLHPKSVHQTREEEEELLLGEGLAEAEPLTNAKGLKAVPAAVPGKNGGKAYTLISYFSFKVYS